VDVICITSINPKRRQNARNRIPGGLKLSIATLAKVVSKPFVEQCHLNDSSLAIPEPSKWDLLLRKLGITDVQAMAEVRGTGDLARAIREFAALARKSSFVPEGILQETKRFLLAKGTVGVS
jgi:hypothetical protein